MNQRPRGAVVVDTGVFGADILRRSSPLVELYTPMLAGRAVLLSFQTVAELRYGALLADWGPIRLGRLAAKIAHAEIVWPGPELVGVYARLRVDCVRAGHALAARAHDADRWVAATAIHLRLPLVAHDGVFRNVPGLTLETALGD
ncbi:MAG TPA: PIN domain-containing protein [Acidimicrobiales bacterium]|nr:PIN domain-containing protein [Acidimicrobiales bacterium]